MEPPAPPRSFSSGSAAVAAVASPPNHPHQQHLFPPHMMQTSKKVAVAMQKLIANQTNVRFSDLFKAFDIRDMGEISLPEFEGALATINARLSRDQAKVCNPEMYPYPRYA
jgi:hypothetical protein